MRRSFQVAGTTFRPKGDILEAFAMAETGQAEVKFVLEPDNKFDPHAVQVFIENVLVGYVPRLNARHVGKIISGENGLGMQNVIVNPLVIPRINQIPDLLLNCFMTKPKNNNYGNKS